MIKYQNLVFWNNMYTLGNANVVLESTSPHFTGCNLDSSYLEKGTIHFITYKYVFDIFFQVLTTKGFKEYVYFILFYPNMIETVIVYNVALSVFSLFSSFCVSHIVTTELLRQRSIQNGDFRQPRRITFNHQVQCIMIPSYDDTKIKDLWYTNEEYQLFRLNLVG